MDPPIDPWPTHPAPACTATTSTTSSQQSCLPSARPTAGRPAESTQSLTRIAESCGNPSVRAIEDRSKNIPLSLGRGGRGVRGHHSSLPEDECVIERDLVQPIVAARG